MERPARGGPTFHRGGGKNMSFAICRAASASRGWKIGGLLLGLLLALGASAQAEMPTMCGGGNQLPVPTFPMPGGQPDLVVNGVCNVNMAQNGANSTVFYYGNVNIV